MQYPTVPQIDVLQLTLSPHVREFGRISECGKYLLVDSGIRQFFFAVEAGTLGFGIRDTAQGTQNPLTVGFQNPNSTD